MKFSCVTPCLNGGKYIEETMMSVLNQSVFATSDFFLHYIIQDGGSTDGTVEIIQRLIKQFSNRDNIRLVYFSESDAGMYDALASGLERSTESDIYSYINAGDFYSPHAFRIVADIFSQNSVQFLTGMNVVYNEDSHLVSCRLPFSYDRNLVLKGFYGSLLPHVQQESTFWGQRLHKKIDYFQLRKFQLSGDYYLWTTFIREDHLYIVNAWLGGFKRHHGQLSHKFPEKYKTEMKRVSLKRSSVDYLAALLQKIADYLPLELKRRLSKRTFFYDHENKFYSLD
jgi:glycosyltransferase involved in cell wall biosynthesis